MPFRFAFPILISAIAAPAMADRLEEQAQTSHVTVFPQGASVEWSVELSAAPGKHELVLPNMPQGIDPNSLRVEAEGARVGAVAVQSSRALPGDAPESSAVTDARSHVSETRAELIEFDAQIATRRAAADAWRERAAVTRDLMRGDARVEQANLQELVDQAGDMIAEYLARAADESAQAELMANRREELQRAVTRAEAALAAVLDDDALFQTLLITVDLTQPAADIRLTAFTESAGWTPGYDLALTRDSGELFMERGLLVWQSSGGDWQDATLTLSTARPQGQSAPSEVASYFPRFHEPMAKASSRNTPAFMAEDMATSDMARLDSAEAAPIESAALARIGMTVSYDYPAPVTIRSGADALRLRLDSKTLATEVIAEAAPRFDDSAFVIAEGSNSLNEPILPGNATLYLDGAMVGRGRLPLVVPGDDLRVGFGPIDGITAELRVPEEKEGEGGFISRKNQLSQTETLIVRNLTSETWPLRVVDRVPVSKQEDLQVDWSASPDPTEEEPDGRRGVLYWEGEAEPGSTREIKVTADIRWPDGSELSR